MIKHFQHGLSRFLSYFAERNLPLLTPYFITRFAKRYGVKAEEAEQSLTQYKTFNEFFTRRLKPGLRPLPINTTTIVSPADGVLSEFGSINQNRLIQAKGVDYSLESLLAGDEELSKLFANGEFATFYLSPKDYHRVHMPLSGKLIKTIYVPGYLFSVSPKTAAKVPDLFAKNERAICIFETEQGPMAVILVGAMIVAGIHTVWTGHLKKKQLYVLPGDGRYLERGAEMGHFQLGSTVILLFSHNIAQWHDLNIGSAVKVKQAIANIK